MMKGHHHQALLGRARGLDPIRTAVVHPVDTVSLQDAIEAAKEKLIVPVLVGPEAKIRAAAAAAKLDLAGYELVPTEHSHAAAAAAVALARDRKVEALMKGSLHTDEFMGAIVHEEKLHTDRRMSHVFVIDVSGLSATALCHRCRAQHLPDVSRTKSTSFKTPSSWPTLSA